MLARPELHDVKRWSGANRTAQVLHKCQVASVHNVRTALVEEANSALASTCAHTEASMLLATCGGRELRPT